MYVFFEILAIFNLVSPLLTYGLAFLIGIAWHPIPAAALLISCGRARLFLTLLVGIAGFAWNGANHRHPEGEIHEGEGVLAVSSIATKHFHGNLRYTFRGVFVEFMSGGKLYKNVPVTFSLSEKGPPHDSHWLASGKIIKRPQGWVYKPDRDQAWIKVVNSSNLAEWRFHLKEKVKKWVERTYPHPRAATLLSALLTGDIDDRALTHDLRRFGLSHLLAISGFHFALLATFVGALIKPWFLPKRASFLILIMLGAYFLFLGASPSILRAFLTLFIFLLCPFFQGEARGENSLGLALIACLIVEPQWSQSIAFQLSFLATAALLILFPPIDNWMKTWLVPRPSQTLEVLSLRQRIPLVLLSFIRQSFSLNIAVTLATFPVLLYLFHQFPLLTLLYNLFFPFLISLSLFLLLISLFIPWLHFLNSTYTNFILNLTHEPPHSWDRLIQTQSCTLEVTLLLISALFLFVLHKKSLLKYA